MGLLGKGLQTGAMSSCHGLQGVRSSGVTQQGDHGLP